MDLTPVGLKEAAIKAITVAKYIIVSMAVVGLGLYVADQTVSWEVAKAAMLVAGANILLAFLQKWVTTNADNHIVG